MIVPIETPVAVSILVEDSSYNEASATFTIVSLPTSEFPAYFLAATYTGSSIGMYFEGKVGPFLENWWLDKFAFRASTNLTSQSALLYDLAGKGVKMSFYAYSIGPAPNTTRHSRISWCASIRRSFGTRSSRRFGRFALSQSPHGVLHSPTGGGTRRPP